MDALAAESFLNAQHRIYGLQMRPLALGHAFALEAIGNPFYDGQLGTPQDLRVAAWICSRAPFTPLRFDSLADLLWRWRTARHDFSAQVAKWKTYVDDYCTPPQMWNKQPKAGEDRTEPSRIPHQITSVVRLMRLGMTEERAWNTPVGIASWYEAAAYESETGSRLDIVTDSERMAILRSKQKEAQNG